MEGFQRPAIEVVTEDRGRPQERHEIQVQLAAVVVAANAGHAGGGTGDRARLRQRDLALRLAVQPEQAHPTLHVGEVHDGEAIARQHDAVLEHRVLALGHHGPPLAAVGVADLRRDDPAPRRAVGRVQVQLVADHAERVVEWRLPRRPPPVARTSRSGCADDFEIRDPQPIAHRAAAAREVQPAAVVAHLRADELLRMVGTLEHQAVRGLAVDGVVPDLVDARARRRSRRSPRCP